MSFVVDASGIENLELIFQQFPQQAGAAMSSAINTIANGAALDEARKEILEQVAFPVGYLDDGDRLRVSSYASPDRLEATITARDRPTSLARFVTGGSVGNNAGLTVTVKPGNPDPQTRGFLITLNNQNTAYAIRLRPGEILHNKRLQNAVEIKGGLTLLYGPSVDQVFRSVSVDIGEPVAAALVKEFTRLLAVKLGTINND